jgi:hypothetical protein
MKIRLFLVIVVLLSSNTAFPQFEYYVPKDTIKEHAEVISRHFFGEKKISFSPNVLSIPDYGMKLAGGVKFQVFLGKRISLDTDFVFGKDYIHGGPGVIAIPFWLLIFNQSGLEVEGDDFFAGFLIMVVAGVLSFEHVSYHIPLKNDWELSPYVSLLRFKQFTPPENMNFEGGQFSFATGIQMDKYIGRFFISPYAEYNIGYRDRISGFNAGVGFGISFPANAY